MFLAFASPCVPLIYPLTRKSNAKIQYSSPKCLILLLWEIYNSYWTECKFTVFVCVLHFIINIANIVCNFDVNSELEINVMEKEKQNWR